MLFSNKNGNHDKSIIKRNKLDFFKKVTLASFLAFGLTTTTAYANDDSFETIYHVYIDGEHVGKVSDESIIENLVNEKIENGNKNYENLNLTIGENITYISEKVFNPSYNNEKVANKLEEEITIMAEATELRIDNDTVGFFHDQETINDVIKEYKLKYIDEATLERMEKEKQKSNDEEAEDIENNSLNNLDLGETQIVNVELNEEVSLVKGKTLPENLLTKNEGLTLLEKGTLEERVHRVDEGEVLSEIAGKYNLSLDKLFEINPSITEDSLIQIDQEINVLEYEPFVDVIVTKEELAEETISYETEVIESDDLYKGEESVKQEGKDGKKEVHYALEIVNGSQTNKEVIDETVTVDPVKEVIIKGTKVIPSRGTGELTNPTVGGYISSKTGPRWGRTHKGIDIARPSNRNILAADNGVVESAGYNNGGYGNKVVINHNNGMKTVYAHLASIDVQTGQTVEKGHKIGVMGSTGNSTGIHLHFEVYKSGSLGNPLDYVY